MQYVPLLQKHFPVCGVSLKSFFIGRDLVWHFGGHRHLVRHHQRLCDRRYLGLHPPPCLRLQVRTLRWSGPSRGGVRDDFTVFALSLCCCMLQLVKSFPVCAAGAWWVMSTPVSQFSGCQILRGGHTPGRMARSCLEKPWSTAGGVRSEKLLFWGSCM